MEEQSTKEFLVNNWEKLPKDIKLLIIGKLNEKDRFKLFQGDKRISDFCRKHKLTADDKVLLDNPEGQLIDTRRKQVDLIRRGFRTVFSLILNEIEFDNGEDGEDARATNIPYAKNIQVLELVFGVDLGTVFFESEGYNSIQYRVHLNMIGLPPNKEDIIKFLFIYCQFRGGAYFQAIHLTENDDLETVLYEFSGTETSEYIANVYTELTEEDSNYVEQLLAGKRVITKQGYLAVIFQLPCP